tara:strand:- start:7109 stop:7246 length:138 start_codon:yes stop_codon:yes gene_type:complete
MIVLELDGGEAVVVHSKELIQNLEDLQKSLKLGDDELDIKGKFTL